MYFEYSDFTKLRRIAQTLLNFYKIIRISSCYKNINIIITIPLSISCSGT